VSQIKVSDADKERFDELQKESETQAEAFSRILSGFENADESVVIDEDAIADRISEAVGPEIELHSYRGVKEAFEETVIQE